jgi:GT2 family glycosyltransferase
LASSVLLRRAVVERAGGYDPAMPPYGEDWDFWLRLHEAGARFVKVPGVRSLYRIRANSLMRSRWRRPLMINRVVLNHKAAYSRLFGWAIGAREEERILRLLRMAADHPDDQRILEALRGTRLCRQFECWSLAYRAVRRLERTIADLMQRSTGR